MISDGIGTMVRPFSVVRLVPSFTLATLPHKRSGAKVGYSLVNGCLYL
jgi:hypothetical protein